MRFETLSTRRVYAGRLLRVDCDNVRLPNGSTTELEMVRHPGAAAIVPFVSDDDILLTRQFLYAAQGFILEVRPGRCTRGNRPTRAPGARSGRRSATAPAAS